MYFSSLKYQRFRCSALFPPRDDEHAALFFLVSTTFPFFLPASDGGGSNPSKIILSLFDPMKRLKRWKTEAERDRSDSWNRSAF